MEKFAIVTPDCIGVREAARANPSRRCTWLKRRNAHTPDVAARYRQERNIAPRNAKQWQRDRTLTAAANMPDAADEPPDCERCKIKGSGRTRSGDLSHRSRPSPSRCDESGVFVVFASGLDDGPEYVRRLT